MFNSLNQTPQLVVSVCRRFPTQAANIDAAWTTVWNAFVEECDLGAGQILGHAKVVIKYGIIKQKGANDFTSEGAFPNINRQDIDRDVAGGWYVRIGYAPNEREEPLQNVASLGDPFWYGIIDKIDDQPNNSADINVGGTVTWECVGVASLLDQIEIVTGAETSAQLPDTTPFDCGYCPKFNERPEGDRGVSVPVYAGGTNLGGAAIFNRYNSTSRWTAIEVIQHLLAFHTQPALPPYGSAGSSLRWWIVDNSGALNYEVESGLDFHNETILKALNYLINPRRGLTWYCELGGANGDLYMLIVVVSGVPETTVLSPEISMIGNVPVDLNMIDSPFQKVEQLTFDHTHVADYIIAKGGHPITVLTNGFNLGGLANVATLQKGWSSDAEDDWDPDEEVAKQAKHDPVWRRFPVTATFSGANYLNPANGLRNFRAVDGNGGWTGVRTFIPGDPAPSGFVLVSERLTRLSLGIDPGTLDQNEPSWEPIAIIKDDVNSYTDLGETVTVRIDSWPAALVLGSGPREAQDLQSTFDNYPQAELMVTWALREEMPLMYSWARAGSAWARDNPRVKLIRAPHVRQWTVLQGTVLGVSEDGTSLIQQSADEVLVDETSHLQALVGLARLWYENPMVELTFSRNYFDIGYDAFESDGRPESLNVGDMVGVVSLGDQDVTVNMVITRKQFVRRGAQITTIYSTSKVLPDLETFK